MAVILIVLMKQTSDGRRWQAGPDNAGYVKNASQHRGSTGSDEDEAKVRLEMRAHAYDDSGIEAPMDCLQ